MKHITTAFENFNPLIETLKKEMARSRVKFEVKDGRNIVWLSDSYYVDLDDKEYPMYIKYNDDGVVRTLYLFDNGAKDPDCYETRMDRMVYDEKVLNKYHKLLKIVTGKIPSWEKRDNERAAAAKPLNDKIDSLSITVPLVSKNGKEAKFIKRIGGSNWEALTIIIDGKGGSAFRYDSINAKEEFGQGNVSIRKTPKEYTIISVEDLKKVLNYFEENYPEDKGITYFVKVARERLEYVLMRLTKYSENKKDKEAQADAKILYRNLKDYQKIADGLRKPLQQVRDEYIEKWTEKTIKGVENYISHIPVSQSVFDYFCPNRKEARPEMVEWLRPYVINVRSPRELVYNYKELIHQQTIKDVDSMIANFVGKNAYKLATIINNKGNLKSIEGHIAGTKAGKFEGSYAIEFEDGSRFAVFSQAVFAEGYIQSAHYRYPTTFHGIILPNGEKHAKFSEEQMIEIFSKARKSH